MLLTRRLLPGWAPLDLLARPIRREMKRRAAVEPVIGHLKAKHRIGRNYLKGRAGDRANAVLAGVITLRCCCAGSAAFARPILALFAPPLRPSFL